MTLGAHEVDDVAAAVEHLRAAGQTTTIGLWGRSMGAVTAMAYARMDPSVCGIVRALYKPVNRTVGSEYECDRCKSVTGQQTMQLQLHLENSARVASSHVHPLPPGRHHHTRLSLQVVDSPFSRLTDLMSELVVEQVCPPDSFTGHQVADTPIQNASCCMCFLLASTLLVHKQPKDCK